MRTDELRLLLSRVRWANLAGLLGLPALALAVALWPRLAPPPPAVPDAAPRPVAAQPHGGSAPITSKAANAGAERRRRAAPSGDRAREARRAAPSTDRAGRASRVAPHHQAGRRSGAAKRGRGAGPRRARRSASRSDRASRAPLPPSPAVMAPSAAPPPDPVAAEFGVP